MKRLISAVLALSLLGTAAASAQPYRGGHENSDRGYHSDYRGGHNDNRGGWNRGRAEGAGMIGLGFGLLALAAIASAHNDRDHYQPYGYNGR